MLKILYDHQCFSNQDFGGISRYFVELIKNINKHDLAQTKLSLVFSNNNYLTEIEAIKTKSFFKDKKFTGKVTLLNYVNTPNTIIELLKNDYDIFHPTYYRPYFLNFLGNKPFILTVHDMIHELYPQTVNRFDKTAKYKRILVNKAKKIITVSHNTKNDLIKILNVPEQKVEVIHLASSIKKKFAISKENFNLPDRYILYVGNRKSYKNFQNLLLAFVKLSQIDDNLHLICSGGGGFNSEEKIKFKEFGLTSKIIHKPADNVTLATLYANSLAFVFPSFYEGFGIPVIEALNCDCPLVLSNVSSLPELAKDAAIYFDPKDVNDIISAISQVIFNEDNRQQLIKKGRERKENFSWLKTARQTIKLYEDIL